jgi:hypothetical protein
MSIKQKDIKLLWGRAANRCAICRCELSYEENTGDKTHPLGEQAHIVAEEKAGPRGASILTKEERNSYANLVLLCPTHHTQIDKVCADYPVERLHLIKTNHELWVRESLSSDSDQTDVQSMVYSHLVDQVVVCARLDDWNSWVSQALTPRQRIPDDLPENATALRSSAIAAVWGDRLPELEQAILTFSAVLLAATNTFMEHARDDGDFYQGERFYKLKDWDPPLYQMLSKQWEAWSDACDALFREATCAANWVAAVVRRDLNPHFYALDGKFRLTEGPFGGSLAFYTRVYEYTKEEQGTLPESVVDRIRCILDPWEKTKSA